VALLAQGGVAGTHKVPDGSQQWHEKVFQAVENRVRSFAGMNSKIAGGWIDVGSIENG
jgi:hypothetical protein